MITRIILFIIGFMLMVIGMSYIIVYSNLLTFGYTFKEYLEYLISRYECLYFIIGLLIIIVIIFRREKNSDKRI